MIPFLAACDVPSGPPARTGGLKFITIVKSTGFNWFRRMETGIRQYAGDTGIQALQQGPSNGSLECPPRSRAGHAGLSGG